MEKQDNSNVEILDEKKDDVAQEQLDVGAQQKKKKGKGGILIFLCLMAVVGILAAIFVPSFLGGKPKTKRAKTDAVTVASPYRLSGNGLENFDLYFLQLENQTKNIVYSPLSIKYALAMLNEGTDGASHEQVAAIIGEYTPKKYNNSDHMSFANAMFIRDTIKDGIKESYTKTLQDKFGAEIILDPFENASNANSWVSNKTFNLVNNLLDDAKVKEEEFILLNALAIDMNWVNRIQSACAPLPEGMGDKYYNVKYLHENYAEYISTIMEDHYPTMTFNGLENRKSVLIGASFNHYDIIKDLGEDNIRKTVGEKYKEYIAEHGEECGSYDEYMDKYIEAIGSNYKKEATSTDFYLYDNDEIKAFAKDLQEYDGVTLQYVAIMPKNASLEAYVKEVDAKSINNIIKNLKEAKYDNFKEGVVTRIKGQIPLFAYEYKLNLEDDLKALGVEDIFDINKADLSKMLQSGKLAINDANHKAKIEFSNDGIKAAAATSMGGAGADTCGFDYEYDVPVEDIDMTFDKPYMYLIRDKKTGEIWFVGSVYEPVQQ